MKHVRENMSGLEGRISVVREGGKEMEKDVSGDAAGRKMQPVNVAFPPHQNAPNGIREDVVCLGIVGLKNS